jgi:AcrR family transcriptional regulator
MADDAERETRSADPRPARTRSAILAAVARLTDRGETVTMAAVVAESGVSRSTVYARYGSLADLLVDTLADAFGDIERLDLELRPRETPARTAAATTAALVAVFRRNRALCRGVFASDVAIPARETLVASFAGQAEGTMRLAAPATVDPVAAARYVAAGSVTVLLDWTLADDPAEDAAVQVQLLALLPAWLIDADEREGNQQ